MRTDEEPTYHLNSDETARMRLEKKMKVERIRILDSSTLFASVGVVADTIYLSDILFDQVTNHKYIYGNSMPISRLAKKLSSLIHVRTLERTTRPFGVHACLIGRMYALGEGGRKEDEDDDLWIYEIDALGNIYVCRWCCIGSSLENASRLNDALRGVGEKIKDSKGGQELVRHCLRCIKLKFLEDLEPHEVCASIIETGCNPRLLSNDEMRELLASV